MHRLPTQKLLIAYLSETFSPSRVQTGVIFGDLEDERDLRIKEACGFANNEELKNKKYEIYTDEILSRVHQKRGIIYASIEELNGIENPLSRPFVPEFGFRIIMPVGLNHIYGIALNEEDFKHPSITHYAETIQSVLGIYESLLKTNIHEKERISSESEHTALTERQSLILELIQARKTNAQIAKQLGYSESLIRQETIVIYRKMHIAGRKDLVRKI